VSYSVTVFIGDAEDPEFKNNFIEFKVIKLQNAQVSREERFPRVFVSKEFMFSPGNIDLEVTLDRELFFHFEKVPVTLLITNASNKTVRSIKCNIIQTVEVSVYYFFRKF
jgi:arrestin-2